MIRVLVVDDSIAVRKAVADRLREAGMDVVGEAGNGDEAVALSHRLRPDVILMDVVMPHVDGLAATRRIMMEAPTPIVILSAHSNRQEVFKVYDALASGALEVCAKPLMGGPEGEKAWSTILTVIRAATQASVIRLQPRAKPANPLSHKTSGASTIDTSGHSRRIVVMGASTGGPAAVRAILQGLPPDFPLPILLAIHCSCTMSVSIGTWLAGQCSLRVYDARDGQVVPDLPGTVIVAPPGRNLMLHQGRTVLRTECEVYGLTPSIDALFTSAAEDCGDALIGVLLTGMGADGAQGLKRIRDGGGATIAQDEASSVVFGMPGEAIKLGAVQHTLPLEQIPQFLTRLASSSRHATSSSGVST